MERGCVGWERRSSIWEDPRANMFFLCVKWSQMRWFMVLAPTCLKTIKRWTGKSSQLFALHFPHLFLLIAWAKTCTKNVVTVEYWSIKNKLKHITYCSLVLIKHHLATRPEVRSFRSHDTCNCTVEFLNFLKKRRKKKGRLYVTQLSTENLSSAEKSINKYINVQMEKLTVDLGFCAHDWS